MRTISPSARRGFTLVELLVTILIISILAALLMSVVPAIRARSKDPQCLSNLRQIHMALSQYASDNSGKWPAPLTHGSNPRFVPIRWYRDGADYNGSSQSNKALDPYISNPKVAMCPIVVDRQLRGSTELQYWYGTAAAAPSRLQAERLTSTDPYPSLAWCTWPNSADAKLGKSPHMGGGGMNVLKWDGSVQSLRYTEWRSTGYP